MLTIHMGRPRIVWCVGNEDVDWKVFEDKRLVQDSSTTVVYIFHIAINISLQNIIHTALSVSPLANLIYWQNESSVYLTPHFFLEGNEILHLVSFHYWHNKKYISELQIYYQFPKTQGSNFCRVLKTLKLEAYRLQLQL